MMLIGLGEPLLDPKIHDRIGLCHDHAISTLISTNGTLLDEAAAEKLLATPLEHITLSFDGAKKETFEFYRKGAKFERVRDNFVRFCELKARRKSKMQIVVQLVRMDGNAAEVEEFTRFWRAVPGVDLIRIKEDETNLMRPDAGHAGSEWKHPCHYLWRGPMYVKHNGDVYPCCQSYMLDGKPVGRIGEQRCRDLQFAGDGANARSAHARARRGDRYLREVLHDDSASGAGGGQPGVSRQDGPEPAAAGREADLHGEAAATVAESAEGGGGAGGAGPDRGAEAVSRAQARGHHSC
jgi:sulfatase maturation enzyme AslB (radical SAM superfamily)